MTRPADAVARAAAFLSAHGDALTRGCAQVVVGAQPVSAALTSLPPSDAPVCVREILGQLSVLDDVGALGTQHASRLCARLAPKQHAEGWWEPEPDASRDARIHTTGMIAGHLAKTPFVRERALDAAAEYLASLWDPDLVKGDAWPTTAAYAHCFSLIRHTESDAILQWCGRELQRGLVTGVYDAVQFAHVYSLCRAHGLPGAPLSRDELVERLCAEQREDGAFGRDDVCGDSSLSAGVAHTFTALVALVRLTGAPA